MFQILAREVRLNAVRTVRVKPITMLLEISFNPRKTMGLASGFAASGLASGSAKRVGKSAGKGSRKSPHLFFYFSNRWLRLFRCCFHVQPQDCRHGIQTAAGVRGRIIYDGLQTEPHPLKLISKSNYFAPADRSVTCPEAQYLYS